MGAKNSVRGFAKSVVQARAERRERKLSLRPLTFRAPRGVLHRDLYGHVHVSVGFYRRPFKDVPTHSLYMATYIFLWPRTFFYGHVHFSMATYAWALESKFAAEIQDDVLLSD